MGVLGGGGKMAGGAEVSTITRVGVGVLGVKMAGGAGAEVSSSTEVR